MIDKKTVFRIKLKSLNCIDDNFYYLKIIILKTLKYIWLLIIIHLDGKQSLISTNSIPMFTKKKRSFLSFTIET